MPLRQTIYGGECPLGKFKIDVPAGAGGYTTDPVKECLSCNFADLSGEGFTLEVICQCPSDMGWDEYKLLLDTYAQASPPGGGLTREGFWNFVEKCREETQSFEDN